MMISDATLVKELGAGDTLGWFGLGVEDAVAGLTGVRIGVWGIEYSLLGNLGGCIIKSLDCKLFSFGNILEPDQCNIIEEPECSTGRVRHNLATLDLNCSTGMM